MGILEVDKSKPIPKLAQDGQDETFTKEYSAFSQNLDNAFSTGFLRIFHSTVPLGPYTFPLTSHEGPSWASLSLCQKVWVLEGLRRRKNNGFPGQIDFSKMVSWRSTNRSQCPSCPKMAKIRILQKQGSAFSQNLDCAFSL